MRLHQGSLDVVTVQYATAPGSAVSPADFAPTSGTLMFNPGETEKTITVSVVNDTLQENTEDFSVNLSGAVNASIAIASGRGYIQDTDASFLTVADIALDETDGPVTALFTVTRTGSLAGMSGATFATSNGTATAPGDYTANNGVLEFAPGEATKTIAVAVVGDQLAEANEAFNLTLSAANNTTLLNNAAQATIVDDDISAFSVSAVAVLESAGEAVFTVRRVGELAEAVTVSFTTQNVSAMAPGDYTLTVGILTFAAGEAEKTVAVPIVDDATQEGVEAFNFNLSAPSNGILAVGSAQGIILDEDQSLMVITGARVVEGDAGTTTTAVFTVQRLGDTSTTSSVNFNTGNNSAAAPSDYAAVSGTLTFAPGETEKTFNVTVNGDAAVENNERFFVGLSVPVNTTIAVDFAEGWIVNDDTPAASYFFIDDVVITEGDAGQAPATFNVTRFGALTAWMILPGSIGQRRKITGRTKPLAPWSANETETGFVTKAGLPSPTAE